ncbi:MAG: hypothetical protein Q9191_001988 [Dirinaria sp. TL-2023a]
MGTSDAVGWHFVHISNPKSARNPATRRFVRATVAANYHRKERQHHSFVQEHATDEQIKANADQKRQKHFLSLVRSKEKGADEHCHSSEVASIHEQVEPSTSAHDDDETSGHGSPGNSWSTSLAKTPTSGHNDPFGIRFAGIEYQSDYGSLLQHFISVVDPFYCPFGSDSGRNNLRYAVSVQQSLADAALYRSILFAASAHRDFSSGEDLSSTALMHKGETIRLINASLDRAPDLVSDFTIAAIAMLAVTQNLTRDSNEQQDLVCALVTVQPARFVQIHCNAFVKAPSWFYSHGVDSDVEDNVNKTSLPQDIQEVAQPIFRDLHFLTGMMRHCWSQMIVCDRMYMTFCQVRASLEHRAINLMSSSEHRWKPYYSTLVGCCMAALSYTHLDLRGYQATCAAVRLAKATLSAHFDDSWYNPSMAEEDIQKTWSLRLWTLCMSAPTALGEDQLSWYANRILCCASELRLANPRQVEQQLASYIWNPANHSFFVAKTWPKVMDILGSVDLGSSPSSVES